MKIMITGSKGMLGRTLLNKFSKYELIEADLPEVDILDAKRLNKFILQHKPDVIIHCAAFTDVDGCESNEEIAYAVNAVGTANVAIAANHCGAKLVAISTDYVFEGSSEVAYSEFDEAKPVTIYGKSKLAGEVAVRSHCPNHLIARVSWLYGAGGPSFVHTMCKLADSGHKELKVVADQIGNPTSTAAVADGLDFLIKNDVVGTVHLTCEGEATWAEFAEEIFQLTNRSVRVAPCTTDEFPRAASRPANSRLNKMVCRINSYKMPHWRDALKQFLKKEGM